MKSRFLLSLVLGLTVAPASALTVTGVVYGDVTPETRIGGFAVTPFGQPLQELVSSSLGGGRFRLSLPGAPPPARAQAVLNSQNVSWPGVIGPVQLSAPAQAGELKLFIYRDHNGNARHDEKEMLREVIPVVGRATLFFPWVNADVTVTADKGYVAALNKGWNALLVDVGRSVSIQPFSEDLTVGVTIKR